MKILISLILCTCSWVSFAHTFSAGAASVVVTPPAGTLLAGYGRDRLSTGFHDNLFAKAVVIRDGDKAIAIVTVDCIGLTRPDIVDIQQLASTLIPDLAPHAIVISSTHTHSGPDVVGLWGKSLWSNGRNERYMTELRQNIVLAITTAAERTVAVKSTVASSPVILDWVKNRSEPGLLDPLMSVMQFVDEGGNVIATLTNYACHPTILSGDNTLVSADYLAGFYQKMSDSLPGEHLFLQGAIGGWVQPLQGDRSIDLAQRLGADLATRSIELLNNADPNPFQAISLRHEVFDVKVENWRFRLMMWLGVLDREIFDGSMRTEAVWFKLGASEFVTHPGETSPAYSLASRELMDSRYNFVLGLSQDAIGYILKPEYFVDNANFPHGKYLTTVSLGAQVGLDLMKALEVITSNEAPDIAGPEI